MTRCPTCTESLCSRCLDLVRHMMARHGGLFLPCVMTPHGVISEHDDLRHLSPRGAANDAPAAAG